MFQEIISSTQDADTVEKAVSFGAIGFNFLVIGLAASATVAIFALKSIKTQVATLVWLKANAIRFVIGGFLILILSILLVVSPDINGLFQAIGFNVEKSPLALGAGIGLLMIGVTAEPSKNPEG